MLLRQILRLRRIFRATVTDTENNLLFTIRRPLYLINRYLTAQRPWPCPCPRPNDGLSL